MNRFNTILTIASGIASVFALCLTCYWAGRRGGRAKAGPQRSVYSARAALEKCVQTILARSPADIDVVGYSVHALLDGLQPAVRRALEAGKRVRVLMLSPRSAGLLEKSALERRSHHGLDLQALRARNAEQIERTYQRLHDLAADVCYQSNVGRVHLEVRSYDQFPVYRGALTASGDTLLASYLIDPSLPGRELEHLCASRDSKLDEATRREVRAFGHWFAYLWEHRSRPFEIEVVLFDLYDTLITVPAEVRRAYRAQIADLIGITVDKLDMHWEATREASNKGHIRTTEDRFGRICELVGKEGDADLPRQLAAIEHEMLMERVEYCPNALETLKALRLRGYLIGVSSNCSVSALNAITGSGVGAHVDLLYLSCQVGEMKPSAVMYVRPVTFLGSSLSRSIFVGNGDNDELGGAKAAGLTAIGVGLRTAKLHGADVTIRDLAELLAVIPDLPAVRSAATAKA